MGRFITFEGGDGSGKSTQCELLYQHLIKSGYEVIKTREIGGTEVGEKIRDIVVNDPISKKTELMLIMAARSEHIYSVIKPALEQGKIVICDRFIDSTAAYQAETEDEIKRIFYLNDLIFDYFLPSITFYLKIDPNLGIKRALERGEINKFEKAEMKFHEKVSDNFDFLAKTFSSGIKTIDASRDSKQIFEDIIEKIKL